MALTQIDDRGLKTPIDLLDNENIRLGTGNDLKLYHDGTESIILSVTGGLAIKDTGGYMRIRSDELKIQSESNETYIEADANGAVQLFYDNSKKFETTNTGAEVTGNFGVNSGDIYINTDSKKLYVGASQDLQIFHDGTRSAINNRTGDLRLLNAGNIKIGRADSANTTDYDETYISCLSNGAVELYYDNSKKFETISYGTLTAGESRADNFQVLDYDGSSTGLMKFGGSDDLKIYHDGSNSKIINSTGRLHLENTNGIIRTNTDSGFYIQSADGNTTHAEIDSDGLKFNGDTAVANALDDYEEGQYTPSVTGSTGQTDVSVYSNENKLNYTKIGNLVNISGRLRMETVSYSGGLVITLPFTAEASTNTSNASMCAVATHGADFDSSAGTGSHMGMFLEIGSNSAYAYFVVSRDNSAWISANNSIITADTYLAFTYTYRAA